jgi:hypothetical protein
MAKNFIVVKLMGRCGNQFYQISTAIAYGLKHNLEWFVTSTAENCDNNAYYFKGMPTRDMGGNQYEEHTIDGVKRYYAEIPHMPNGILVGYWQCFKYFDEYREQILEAFNLPYLKSEFVSIHVRRGDFLVPNTLFPPLSLSYYQKAVSYMNRLGYYRFKIFSDDIEYCKSLFNEKDFIVQNGLGLPFSAHEDFFVKNGTELVNDFLFSEGKTELEDLTEMANCQHNILANSSFSFAASWLNRNPEKIVLTPDKDNMFIPCNIDMIPDSYIQIVP